MIPLLANKDLTPMLLTLGQDSHFFHQIFKDILKKTGYFSAHFQEVLQIPEKFGKR